MIDPEADVLAPVALFAYGRPGHLKATVASLADNVLATESDLFVFSDGPKDSKSETAVGEVRDYIRTIRGFKTITVVEQTCNRGLANSIIAGVSQLCAEHGRVIVLEDDMVTSRWFLQYMNDALRVYEDDEQVASIHGYAFKSTLALPETYFLEGADCWGWATWARAWRHFNHDGTVLLAQLNHSGRTKAFDLDGAYGFTDMLREQIEGKNDSWAVRWHASCFLRNMLTLHPGRSLVVNIGNDASGTHGGSSDYFLTQPTQERVRVERIPLVASERARQSLADFLGTSQRIPRRILRRITHALGYRR
jgi:hypothetical protein